VVAHAPQGIVGAMRAAIRVKAWLKQRPAVSGGDFGHEESDHRFREAYHADDPVHYELVIEIGETKNDD
jgi:hypothetical protein